MPINLSRIGHCAVRVRDLDRAKKFYGDVLGFKLVEEDHEHGLNEAFMSLGMPGDGHVLDLNQVDDPDTAASAPEGRNFVGVAHIALKVDNNDDLKAAHDHLVANGVQIDRMIEHVNQRSFYFADPDGNRLEIYWEYPTSPELFHRGRGDRDFNFAFEDPPPPWSKEVPSDWDPEKTVDLYHRGRARMMD